MAVLKDTEDTEKDLDTGADDDEAEDSKVETPEPPQDPNEPIEVVTADAQKLARKERRAQRQSEFRAAQEERDRLRRENEELRARSHYQPPPQQQQPQMHPAAQRLQQLDQMEKQLHDHYRARSSQPDYRTDSAEHQEFERKARELQTAKMGVIAAAQQPQINEAELIRKAQLQMYLNEHADISQDPTKMQWAYARWQQYQAEGKDDTKELSDSVFDEARRRFGMKPRNGSSQAADPATRQRLTGISSRGAGPGPDSSGVVQLSAHDKRMARIAFGDRMSEKEAYQHFANTVGKKRLEQQKSKGG